jgi:5-methylcytosine-specific restriction endonuclease McrA
MHYITEFRQKRKRKIINLLGEVCSQCGGVDSLEVDHIDPSTKSFTLSGNNLNKSWESILEELDKCQLLCNTCHTEKTSLESKIRRPVNHGTEWMYTKYKCRCSLCVDSYSIKRRSYPSRKTIPL